ncbi:MAG: capsular polysaccharide synthesis protein [Agathobacter sp.]
MGEFSRVFKKVGGKQVLKQYAKSHVLLFALAETVLVGFSKKSLEIVRLAVSNRIFQKLKKKNMLFIKEFVANHDVQIEEKKHANIIWTIWLQGMDQAPEVVQKCYASMKENIQDKEIIVITEDNYSNYVQFPDYIMEKYKKGIISKVHFADLLRIELLANHGGTWLDGTVYCSGPIRDEQRYILDADLFLYQTLKPGLDGMCSCISSWLMTASTGNPIILLTRSLLHNYWKNYDYAVDYFILHNFFQMAIEAYPEEWNKVVPFSNEIPHILLLRLFEEYDDNMWNVIKHMTPFHKLTYKFDDKQRDLKNTYYSILLIDKHN